MIFHERFDAINEEVLRSWANSTLNNLADTHKSNSERLILPADWQITNIHEAVGYLPEIAFDIFSLQEFSPVIKISQDECTLFNQHEEGKGILDILGRYIPVAPNESGEIIFFEKCIDQYSKSLYENTLYLKGLFIDQLDCKNAVYKIVLFHELGHWITHWSTDSRGKKWSDDFWSLSPNPNDLLEGLAQYLTYHFILTHSKARTLKLAFEHMLWGQSSPYQKHVDIQKIIGLSDLESFFRGIEEIRSLPKSSQVLEQFISSLETRSSI